MLNNSIGILCARLLAIATTFLVVPVLLGQLGISGFGALETLTAIAATCNLLPSIICGVVLRQSAEAFGAGAPDVAVELARKGITAVLICLILSLPIIFIFQHEVVVLFGFPLELQRPAIQAVAVVIGITLLIATNEVLAAFLSAQHKSGQATFIIAIAQSVGNIILAVCVSLKLGLFSLPAGLAFNWLTGFVLLWFACRRANVKFSFRLSLPHCRLPVGTRRYGIFLTTGTVALYSRDSLDKLIMGVTSTSDWAGFLGIASRLASPVSVACTLFYIPTIATSAALFARRDWIQINQLYLRTTHFIVTFAGCIGLFIYAIHEPLLKAWLGKCIPEVSEILAWLLTCNVVALMLTGATSSICKGVRMLQPELVYIGGSLLLNILLKLILVGRMGPIGTTAASSLSWSAAAVLFVYLAGQSQDMSRRPLRFAAASCSLYVLLLFGVAKAQSLFMVAQAGTAWQWIAALVIAVTSILIYIFTLFLVFGNTDLKSFFKAIQDCRGRKGLAK